MQNPLNLRRGAQYTGIANGVPTPSIESDECDPVESEVNQQEPRNIVSPSSVNGPHVQPTAVVSEIPLSETERALEGAICATMTLETAQCATRSALCWSTSTRPSSCI